MAATGRMNHELKRKAKEAEKNATDPVELLRCKCLQRGANGIKGLARLVDFIYRKSCLFIKFKFIHASPT